MLTWETLRNLPKVDAKDSESGFGALLPGMDHGHNELFATTTTGDAFGMGTKETKADKRFMRGPRAPIAGGPGSGRTEKGLRTSNAIGENVLSEADPQKNTEAQRSWLYSQDVMFENPGGPEAVSWGEMQHAMRCADAPMRRCADAPPPHCTTATLPHCPTASPLHCPTPLLHCLTAPLLCAWKRSGFIARAAYGSAVPPTARTCDLRVQPPTFPTDCLTSFLLSVFSPSSSLPRHSPSSLLLLPPHRHPTPTEETTRGHQLPHLLGAHE